MANEEFCDLLSRSTIEALMEVDEVFRRSNMLDVEARNEMLGLLSNLREIVSFSC